MSVGDRGAHAPGRDASTRGDGHTPTHPSAVPAGHAGYAGHGGPSDTPTPPDPLANPATTPTGAPGPAQPAAAAGMRGHVIVTGLDTLAVRVAEQLHGAGVQVVVVDDGGDRRLAVQLERIGVSVLTEPGGLAESLLDAGLPAAAAVVACDDSDLRNLETALSAAELAPGVPLVVRFANERLGQELAHALPHARPLSLAAMAGPSFVEACVQSEVLHAFPHGGQLLQVVDVVAERAGVFRQLYGSLTPVTLRPAAGRAGGGSGPDEHPDGVHGRDGGLQICPGRDTEVRAGDRLALLGRPVDFADNGVRLGEDEEEAARILAALSGREARERRPRRQHPPGTLLQRFRESVAAVLAELNRPFRIALTVVLLIILASTLVLTLAYHNRSVVDPRTGRPATFTPADALYFSVEVMSTVGFGDYNFALTSGWLKIFGTVLIVVGAASVSVVYAFVTNAIVSRRLEQAFGRRRATTARDHVILCGLGSVGVAVMEGLLDVGREVVVIERDEENRYLAVARNRGVPVIAGDATLRTVLRQANIGAATTLAAMTSDDLANVETVLTARAVAAEDGRGDADGNGNGDGDAAAGRLRVVVRVFDTRLAHRVESRFGLHSVRSASALAAPWFVGAALGYEVVSTFYAERQPFLVARMPVVTGGGLDGARLADMGAGIRVLAVGTADGGQPEYRPTRHTVLRPGDEALLVGPYEQVVATFRRSLS